MKTENIKTDLLSYLISHTDTYMDTSSPPLGAPLICATKFDLKNNSSWSSFNTYSEETILKTLMALNPSNHFTDPLPANYIKDFIPLLLPLWTKIINTSLLQGTIPEILKAGQVSPPS